MRLLELLKEINKVVFDNLMVTRREKKYLTIVQKYRELEGQGSLAIFSG